MIDIIGLFLSALAILISVATFCKTSRRQKIEEAAKLVSQINYKKEITDEERRQFGIHSIPVPVIIKNNSSGEFKDIIVILVEDARQKYVKQTKFFCRVKNIDRLQSSIAAGFYRYIPAIIDREEILVSSGGSGMHKVKGVVLVFKDGIGNEWIKDANNEIYFCENALNKLIQIGLPVPGFESHVVNK